MAQVKATYIQLAAKSLPVSSLLRASKAKLAPPVTLDTFAAPCGHVRNCSVILFDIFGLFSPELELGMQGHHFYSFIYLFFNKVSRCILESTDTHAESLIRQIKIIELLLFCNGAESDKSRSLELHSAPLFHTRVKPNVFRMLILL